MMGAATQPVTRELDVPETTFTGHDLTTFLGLEVLGLTAVGQHLTAKHTVIECRTPVGFEDPFCKVCGTQGQAHGTVARSRSHVPVWERWRPIQSLVRCGLRLHYLSAPVEIGHLGPCSAAGAADPLGSGVGDVCPCPGAHVDLQDSSRSGDLPAHSQQRDPAPDRADHHRQPSPLRRCGGPRRR